MGRLEDAKVTLEDHEKVVERIRDGADDAVDLRGTVVCTLTGHGLKDPERAIKSSPAPVTVDPTIEAVRAEVER